MYACDYAGGTKCGPETVRRLERAQEYRNKHPDDEVIIVLAAGYKVSRKSSRPSFKAIMKNYLEKEWERKWYGSGILTKPRILCAKDNHWGTFAETIGMNKIITSDKTTDDYEVIVVSSRYHLPRIKLIWRLVSKQKIQTLGVRGSASKLSPPFEFLKIPHTFLKYSKYLWKEKEIVDY